MNPKLPRKMTPLWHSCRVSVVIKALNEEQRIRATIESALRAVSAVGGG